MYPFKLPRLWPEFAVEFPPLTHHRRASAGWRNRSWLFSLLWPFVDNIYLKQNLMRAWFFFFTAFSLSICRKNKIWNPQMLIMACQYQKWMRLKSLEAMEEEEGELYGRRGSKRRTVCNLTVLRLCLLLLLVLVVFRRWKNTWRSLIQ